MKDKSILLFLKMEKETKICQHCKKEFSRTDETDFIWEIKKYCFYSCRDEAYSQKYKIKRLIAKYGEDYEDKLRVRGGGY